MTSEEDQVVIDAMNDALSEVAVPESLHPERVRARLQAIEREESARAAGAAAARPGVRGAVPPSGSVPAGATAAGPSASRRPSVRVVRSKRPVGKILLAAACLALVAGVDVYGIVNLAAVKTTAVEGLAGSIAGNRTAASVEDLLTDDVLNDIAQVRSASRQPGMAAASSYDEIRASLIAYEAQSAARYENMKYEGVAVTGLSGGETADAGIGGLRADGVDAAPAAPAETKAQNAEAESAVAADFTDTNVRTEGVGEADVVKTDGTYLYALQDNGTTVAIVDPGDGRMRALGSAQVPNGAQISEFYVEGGCLFVLSTDYTSGSEVAPSSDSGAMEDVLYASETPVTRLDVFDVSDPASPRMTATHTQSGGYRSSRFVDGYLYVFSNYWAPGASGSDDPATYVPLVNGKAIACTDVYLPPNVAANQYLVVASVAADDPTQTVSQKAVLSDYGQLYVSAENIYVYETVGQSYYDVMPLARTDDVAEGEIDDAMAGIDAPDQEADESDASLRTHIRKLSYRDGQLEGVAQAKVDGTLDDSFCIDEHDGTLRLVATVYDGNFDSSNAVYVLDENLEPLGSIEGLAEDERVYSARLMGDTGYFVTFRETDPLFTVDFSDPANPQIVGSLKIPGFSEYLHPYAEGLLLGIGMDAEEDTGVTNGLKLSMFDTSDPTDVREVAKTVIDDCYYSDVFSDYRAVLVDPANDMIGFAGSSNRGETYYVFGYTSAGGFTERMAEDVNGNSWMTARGVRIGDVLYVVKGNAVESYRVGSYEKIDDLLI